MKKPVLNLVILIWVFQATNGLGESEFGGGSGTVDDPYQIADPAHLRALANMVHDEQNHFRLTTDLDLSDSEHVPIGSYAEPFLGCFDGNGHIIMHIIRSYRISNMGLFGCIGPGGYVRNLGLVDVDIRVSADYVGALVGFNQGTIVGCFATGYVRGNGRVGGLCGYNEGTISRSYAHVETYGYTFVGGLVGYLNEGILWECFATGSVKVGGYPGIGGGGLVGNGRHGRVIDCFWDQQTSGKTESEGGLGKDSSEMRTVETYQANGWDFIFANDGLSDAWAMPEPDGYPILWWQVNILPALPAFAGGAGILESPFRISNAEHLNAIGTNPRLVDKHFILINNIDLYNHTTLAIGVQTVPFTGTFNGGGFLIRGLNRIYQEQSDSEDIGLFGYIGRDGRVSNLGIVDVDLSGDGMVGALTPHSEGVIWNCFSTGRVQGKVQTGGLLASNDGEVTGCYSECIVSGSDEVGGLIAVNTGQVADCYATGEVLRWGFAETGGLVAVNTGILQRCYSTGRLNDAKETKNGLVGVNDGIVHNCFWDIDTSGQSYSAGGKGRHSTELQCPETFFGWNSDDNKLWTLDAGTDYPRLIWEERRGDLLPVMDLSDLLPGEGTSADPLIIHTARDFAYIGMFRDSWDKHFRLSTDLDLIKFPRYELDSIGLEERPFTGCFDGAEHTLRGWIPAFKLKGAGLFADIGPEGIVKNVNIEDFVIQGSDDVGALAGRNRGKIDNCHVQALVMGYRWGLSVGVLAGVNSGGHITHCSTKGACIGGILNIGGLVGYNEEGIIQECWSETLTWGQRQVGGLAGENSGEIVRSAAKGSVSGAYDVGGLAGVNSSGGRITDSYALGQVSGIRSVDILVGTGSSITRCFAACLVLEPGSIANDGPPRSERHYWRGDRDTFWDATINGQTPHVLGSGRSTAEMQQAALYLQAGWDFENTWEICEGRSYPRLQWEQLPCDD